MAQRLENISLGSPGFYGLNTQSSPVELPPQFCTVAENCIIDQYGRLGARKGFNTQTDGITGLGGEKVKRVFEGAVAGTHTLFAVGNNKIFRIDTTSTTNDTLTELTLPGGYTISDDNWDFIDFNGEVYFVQDGQDILMGTSTSLGSDALVTADSESSESVPDAPQVNCIAAAYGRLWGCGSSAAPSTVYWSDTLIGDGWTEGASGSINLTTVWPNGYDEAQAIAFHNGRLIIFGKNSILIYAGADDPSTMSLEDFIIGTGCIARDSVQNTGSDIIFLSPTGLRLLSRTIIESSLPLGEITSNVRRDVIHATLNESIGINSVYSQEEGFYLLIYEGQSQIYCVDFKQALDEGVRRITSWSGSLFNCACRAVDGTLYVGGSPGIGTYSGYQDDGESYRYQYSSPSLTFGKPASLKFPKKIRPIIIGGSGFVATVSWSFGYNDAANTQTLVLESGGALAEYNISEYNIAEFSTAIGVSDEAINANGSGTEVKLGISADINGSGFSLQQINIQALIGRLI